MAGTPRDWQMGCTEIKQRGCHLLNSGQWSDCTFLVGTEPNQVIMPGHKLVLAMSSPVFEAMFFGGMAERNDPIPILDVQPEAFKALLEYIYTDNIDITSFDKACELCYGAKKYMLPHLVKECTRYLWSDLSPRNACRAYEFARLFEENVLMDKCIQIISANTKEVLSDSSFEEVDLNTVITVFSLDHLNVDSELDLFEAAVRYDKAQSKSYPERSVSSSTENGPPSQKKSKSPKSSTFNENELNVETASAETSSSENSPENAMELGKGVPEQANPGPSNVDKRSKKETKNKLTIRSAIKKIRFLTVTATQFAAGPARSSLLTESEAFAVLMNILSSAADIPMPAGFSTCRVPRKQLIGGGHSSNMPTFTVDTPSPVSVEQVFGMEVLGIEVPRPANPHNHVQQSVPRVPRHEGIRVPPIIMDRMDHAERQSSDFNRIYCQRAVIQHTECYNASVLDCSVTFMVDKNICLLGVQVPTQGHCDESAIIPVSASTSSNTSYSELLYAHLLDADGARLTYTHYTARVPYRHQLDVMFNRPVYIQRSKVYKLGIVFNKAGWYPMGVCAQQVVAESVFFNFGIGQSTDSVRDGLIRSVIFMY